MGAAAVAGEETPAELTGTDAGAGVAVIPGGDADGDGGGGGTGVDGAGVAVGGADDGAGDAGDAAVTVPGTGSTDTGSTDAGAAEAACHDGGPSGIRVADTGPGAAGAAVTEGPGCRAAGTVLAGTGRRRSDLTRDPLTPRSSPRGHDNGGQGQGETGTRPVLSEDIPEPAAHWDKSSLTVITIHPAWPGPDPAGLAPLPGRGRQWMRTAGLAAGGSGSTRARRCAPGAGTGGAKAAARKRGA